MLIISEDEYETLRRLSFEQRVPIAKLIRAAIDKEYGTNDDEIQPPGRKPGEEQMTRCVIYCRVSTDAQERDGTSLETQERACAEYAEAQGWAIVGTVRDAASGFTLDRPGMEQVRKLLRDADADVILAFAIDRSPATRTKSAFCSTRQTRPA